MVVNRGANIFQKCRGQLKILFARKVTWSTFHVEDPQILGATVQNVVAPATWHQELRTAGGEYKSPICNATEFLTPQKDWENTPICSKIVLKNDDSSVEEKKWCKFNSTLASRLILTTSEHLQNFLRTRSSSSRQNSITRIFQLTSL
jgi:hypothetical protein